MRNESDIKNLIIEFTQNDDRIRAVLLSGSRANPKIKPDKFQDFDIVFIVRNLESFTSNHNWTNVFGEKLIWQLPNEMSLGRNDRAIGFSYLMLFKDGNRIDLTLFPLGQIKTDFKIDSLTIVWLDKDKLFTKIHRPNDADYYIQKPTEKEFLETCNEFWWVSTYVAKGLIRNEITSAKEILETVVRPMFMKLIEWKIGVENDFLVSFGKSGKFIKKYLANDDYNSVLETYTDFDIKNNWKSLFIMIDLFGQFANELTIKLKFRYNKTEQQNTIKYLKQLYEAQEN